MEAEKQEEQPNRQIKRHLNSYTGLSKRTKQRNTFNKSVEIFEELRANTIITTTAASNFPCNINSGSKLHLEVDVSEDKESSSFFNFNSCLSDSEISSCYCSDSEEPTTENKKFSDSLAAWSIKYNVTHSALSELLHVLHNSFPDLPLSSRSLLKTPRYIDTLQCDNGSLVYFGLLNNILRHTKSGLTECNYPLIRILQSKMGDKSLLSVTLNVDGLPLHSSTKNSFWPILGILDQSLQKTPFVIALFYGESKPSNSDIFLRPLVDECIKLETDGIFLNNIHYAFRISCVIADAPARSFIKSIVQHNSLHGCEKCTQEGTYQGRTTWPYTKRLILRNDENFKNHQYEDHHRAKSLLTELQVGLITQVPLDYMHLICLGVVKRLIGVWSGKGPKKCKLRFYDIDIISKKLASIKNHIPCEFARRPRSLTMYKYWKATEFRLFLLYLGPVVLRDVLPAKFYEHFLILHCAIYILASELSQTSEWRNYANDLLHAFVEAIGNLYAKELITYNFHNLLHLAADVTNFGCLDNYSAFPFESNMSKIKRLVRSPNNPLQQLSKRLLEFNNFEVKHYKPEHKTIYKNGCIQSIFVEKLGCIVGTSEPNSCFLTVDNEVVVITCIKNSSLFEEYNIHCDVYTDKASFYTLPIESEQLGVFSVYKKKKKRCIISSFKLKKKCLLLPNFQDAFSFVCIPYCNMNLCH